MSNWYSKTFKFSWNTGIPLMDQYSNGERPSSADHLKDPRSLVNAVPQFGGEKRKGYPRDTSAYDADPTDAEKLKGELPGENVLMDQDPPTGEGVRGDEFTARGEANSDNDVIPNEDSRKLDKGPVGPHNMFDRNLFKDIKKKYRIRGINTS